MFHFNARRLGNLAHEKQLPLGTSQIVAHYKTLL